MAYQGGLRKWFKEDWVDIGSKKKRASIKNVVVSLLRVVKENTLNVFQRLKLEQ